jgi:hypothetical protein
MAESLAVKVKRWKSDFPAYAREVLRIKTKQGTLVPFELNRAQRALWDLVKKDLDAGRPVRVYILKARQLGFSTFVKGLEYWHDTLNRFQNSLTVSHSMDSAQELFTKHTVFYSMSPSEVRPARKRSNRREMRFMKDPSDEEVRKASERGEKPDIGLQSTLIIQTAENPHLGASFTIHFAHLSEFARYEKIQKDVRLSMATLMASVPTLPNTYVFLETTAWGLGYSKDFWDRDDNGFHKFFVSWVADDAYTVADFHDELEYGRHSLDEVEDGPYGNELEVWEHVKRELKRWYPEEADDEKWLLHQSLCRMAWRRKSIRVDHQADLELFRQEFPCYAEEAFLTSGDHVFDVGKIADIKKTLRPTARDLRFPPDRFRFHKQRRAFYRAQYGPLRIYEEPKTGVRYVIGADVSEGVGHGDASAAAVLSIPELKQVAVFHAGYRNDYETQPPIDPDDFADVLDVLGRNYNTAYIACEVNGPGFATNLKLGKTLHYPAIYRREVMDAKMGTLQKKYGWHSNKATKNVLITDLRAAIRDDLIQFRDLLTLDELGHYVQINNQFGAAPGQHDDLVIALGLAMQMAITQNYGSLLSTAPVLKPVKPEGTFEWWGKLVDRQRAVRGM